MNKTFTGYYLTSGKQSPDKTLVCDYEYYCWVLEPWHGTG